MSGSATTGDAHAFRDPQVPDATLDREADYLHAEHTLRSWFFTTDHKRIALLYLASITAFFVSARSPPASCASLSSCPTGRCSPTTPTTSCSPTTAS